MWQRVVYKNTCPNMRSTAVPKTMTVPQDPSSTSNKLTNVLWFELKMSNFKHVQFEIRFCSYNRPSSNCYINISRRCTGKTTARAHLLSNGCQNSRTHVSCRLHICHQCLYCASLSGQDSAWNMLKTMRRWFWCFFVGSNSAMKTLECVCVLLPWLSW